MVRDLAEDSGFLFNISNDCGSLCWMNAWEEGIRVGDMGESYTFLSFHDRMEPMSYGSLFFGLSRLWQRLR